MTQYADELIGEVGGQFRYDRRALLESVSRRAQDEVERYDAESHARDISLSVRTLSPEWRWQKPARLGSVHWL